MEIGVWGAMCVYIVGTLCVYIVGTLCVCGDTVCLNCGDIVRSAWMSCVALGNSFAVLQNNAKIQKRQ